MARLFSALCRIVHLRPAPIGIVSAWLALQLTAAQFAGADDQKPLLRTAYTEFPPFEYRDPNGQPAGRFVELTRRVAEEAGYDLAFIHLPVSRVYLYLSTGRIDFWPGMTRIPALAPYVVTSRSRPVQAQLNAWSLANRPALEHFDELQGHTLILISGYTYGGLAELLNQDPGLRIAEAPNHEAAINMLARGRGDYLLGYRHPVESLLERIPAPPLRQSPLRLREGAWLVSRKRADAEAIRDAFDAAYKRLVERGEVDPPPATTNFRALPGYPLLPGGKLLGGKLPGGEPSQ